MSQQMIAIITVLLICQITHHVHGDNKRPSSDISGGTQQNPTPRNDNRGNKTTGAPKGRPDTSSALQSDWIHSSDIICGSRSGSLGVAVSYLWKGIRSI